MSLEMKNNLKNLLKKLESRASYLYKYHYRKYIHIHYNNLIIENLMCNGRCHLVAVFKNYLIEDDNSEYLRRFYKSRESGPRLKKLFLYHEETSVIFPNYTPLVESKYLYNNVIKKQRVIDEQQDLENKRNDLKLKKKNKEVLKREEKVFNSTIIGEILTSSESVLRIMFGIENNNKNNNKKVSTKNINDKLKANEEKNNNKNNNDDDSDCIEFKQLIKEVENAEENMNNENNNNNSLVGYKLNSNNALKYKLKLINNSNNNQIKNKNYDKMNNITNNSTNITSSSNNINVNINLNKIKNNSNLSYKDNFLLSKNGLKLNPKIRNSITITNSNSIKNNINEKETYKNSLTIQNHKKSNSTIPNRTLYGLNFHQNRNLIDNIINQDKKPFKSNSNSHSNNTSRMANTNSNTYNNYIYNNNNNNFPHHSKKKKKKKNILLNSNNNNNNSNSNKFNTSNKSNKALAKIPKIDLHKLDIINTNANNNNNKLLTLTNRNLNSNRNHNYILNNPNLFFAETEVLKTERNIMKKKNQKKELIKSIISPTITFSPANHFHKSKAIFGRNSHTKLVVINDQNSNNIKSMSQKKNKNYFSNKNINKSNKKLIINDYNYKINPNNINKENYTNRYHRK